MEISKSVEIQNKLKEVVDKIVRMFDVERCSLMIRGETNALEIIASQGLPEEIIKGTKLGKGEGIAGLVVKEGRSILEKNIEGSKLPDTPGKYKTASFLAVPIKINDEVIGVINITDKKDAGFFDEKDKEAIKEFADEVSQLFSKNQD